MKDEKAVEISIARPFRVYAFLAACLLGVAGFAFFYFRGYAQPYMNKGILDISTGWQYYTDSGMQPQSMDVLRHVEEVKPNEIMYLTKTLDEEMENAALMLKTNHQRLRMLLDGEEIFASPYDPAYKNPGMGLHFVPLPADYKGRTLQLELSSPYGNYAGAPRSVYMGDMPSLEAYALSRSMSNVLLMVLCIAAGVFIMVLSILRGLYGSVDWSNFFFGLFSIIWGFYYPATEYIVHQFFSPRWVSLLSIGLYFLYPLPLFLYFYFQFTRCRKACLPVLAAHALFVAAAYGLQLSGTADFPQLLNINNPLYVLSSVYLIVLACVEIRYGNRFIRFTIPWVMLAFAISLYSLVQFYTTRIRQEDSWYHEMFFMLIMVVWFYNLKEFFRQREQEKNDLQVLKLKNRLALESYETMKAHLKQIGILRHEMNNHYAALQILAENQRLGQLQEYLAQLTVQNEQVSKALYCENYLVNAILNTRLSGAADSGIRIAHSIEVPARLAIGDADLCSLLMNILDNALEACSSLEWGAPRWIDLKIRLKHSYLYISCANSKSNAILMEGGQYLSSKPDKESHGYGIRMLRQLAAKYEGMLDITHTQDSFVISLAVKALFMEERAPSSEGQQSVQ